MSRRKPHLAASQGRTVDRDRKAEHITLALDDRMQLDSNFFEEYQFEHCALPEIDFDDIDVSTTFLGKIATIWKSKRP